MDSSADPYAASDVPPPLSETEGPNSELTNGGLGEEFYFLPNQPAENSEFLSIHHPRKDEGGPAVASVRTTITANSPEELALCRRIENELIGGAAEIADMMEALGHSLGQGSYEREAPNDGLQEFLAKDPTTLSLRALNEARSSGRAGYEQFTDEEAVARFGVLKAGIQRLPEALITAKAQAKEAIQVARATARSLFDGSSGGESSSDNASLSRLGTAPNNGGTQNQNEELLLAQNRVRGTGSSMGPGKSIQGPPGQRRLEQQRLNNQIRAEQKAAGKKPSTDAEINAVVKGAKKPTSSPKRIYSSRELNRRTDNPRKDNSPNPNHNFPESFNGGIFKGTKTKISDSYTQYTKRGTLNGRSGTFEIGVRPSNSGRSEIIVHRFFRPDKR